jgi:hypothetical protein
MTMTLIETKTLGAAAASIEFTSIPQDGTDLVVLTSLRSVNDESLALISFNGSTSNFSERFLRGNGSTVDSAFFDSGGFARIFGASVQSSQTANTFSNGTLYIPNYTGSTNKSASGDSVNENNATAATQIIVALLWSDTSAITSLAVASNSGDLAIGSTVSLYKVTKGSDGIVTTS